MTEACRRHAICLRAVQHCESEAISEGGCSFQICASHRHQRISGGCLLSGDNFMAGAVGDLDLIEEHALKLLAVTAVPAIILKSMAANCLMISWLLQAGLLQAGLLQAGLPQAGLL